MDDYDKILAERIVLAEPRLPATVLRLPMVYGPGDDQHRFFPYLKRMDDDRPAILLGDEATWRSAWGYVENVAEAIALAVEDDNAAGRTYNVADEPPRTLQEWVEKISLVVGWTGEVVRAIDDPRATDGHRWRQDLLTDSTRLRQDLNFAEPVPCPVALTRTIAWERAHPPSMDPTQYDYAAEDAAMDRARMLET